MPGPAVLFRDHEYKPLAADCIDELRELLLFYPLLQIKPNDLLLPLTKAAPSKRIVPDSLGSIRLVLQVLNKEVGQISFEVSIEGASSKMVLVHTV